MTSWNTLAPKPVTHIPSDSLGSQVEPFLRQLSVTTPLPSGFSVLDVYSDAAVQQVLHEFCHRYYAGTKRRIGMWGINPGRFGAGTTGLPFTDPMRLKSQLGIDSLIVGRSELSAEFVSLVIEAYGGPLDFYRDVYLTGFSPLGYLKDTKNINFYDDAKFLAEITPEIRHWVAQQQKFSVIPDRCIVLGSGKLKKFVESDIRTQLGFKEIEYLEHPRYIMQYKRPHVSEYVAKYVKVISRFNDGI